ncbi:hypothetical protein ASZ78_002464 [Callipepla squamata]|uniref:Uncharacterized protein n=1 Tax=Callipepla squamata TaxID=9009 RepID=A0A226MCE6_CALSU|nr:hypothetical protein ASZ78_002464 [Callipepla squamata]
MAALGGLLLLLLLVLLLLLAAGLYCCYVWRVHAAFEHIPGAPRERSKKYGPIVRVNAFHRVSVLILSPEGVKEFLMSPEYPKDRLVYGQIFNLFGVR